MSTPRDGLFTYLYNSMDHGSSVHFSITKTGIEGEMMVFLTPGRTSENETWLPPMIFKEHYRTMDDRFLEELKKTPFRKNMDMFQNRDFYLSTTEALEMIVGALMRAQNAPKKSGRKKELQKLGNAAFRLKDWETALEHYTALNQIEPDEHYSTRIEMCIGYIAKQKRDKRMGFDTGAPDINHEEETDPFKGEDNGFEKK